MVVSKVEFNNALKEINDSYGKLVERIEKLEEQLEASKSTPAKKATAKQEQKDAA